MNLYENMDFKKSKYEGPPLNITSTGAKADGVKKYKWEMYEFIWISHRFAKM